MTGTVKEGREGEICNLEGETGIKGTGKLLLEIGCCKWKLEIAIGNWQLHGVQGDAKR